MKRWLVMILILAGSGAALYYSQRQKTETRVGPEAVLNALADTQREMSRVPARLARLSDDDEIRIGDGMAQDYLARRGRPSPGEVELEKYVAAVGSTVSAGARRKLDYRFHYVPDANFMNAFALPGGHVFIGKGLLQLMQTEDELASVLGHEVEHVDNYHCNERVALRHLPLGELIALPVELFQAGYSKEQELEADRDGADLAVRAGYSPQGAIHLFQTFGRLEKEYVSKAQSPDQELSQVAIKGIVGYFRSHPLPAEREAQIRRIMASQKWPQPAERNLRVRPEPVRTAGASH
jgi:beta-barrel assembly-enhancing protease